MSLLSGCSQAKGSATLSPIAEAKHQAKSVTAAPQIPGDVAERDGEAAVEQARAGNDNRKRWLFMVMESDATADEVDTLVMSLVKAAKFELRLQPKHGHIILTKPGIRHAFKLANTAGSIGNIFPNYNVRVLEASNPSSRAWSGGHHDAGWPGAADVLDAGAQQADRAAG